MANITRYQDFGELEYINEDADLETDISWKGAYDKVVTDYGSQFYFITTFGVAIKALIPVVNSLIQNMELSDVEINKETIILLTICAVAIQVGEAKGKYKKFFEELRLRGVYDVLKKLVPSIDLMKKIFSIIAKVFNKTMLSITDMFGYTALLLPFLKAIDGVINMNGLNLDSFASMSLGDAVVFGVGMASFGVKQLMILLMKRMKSYKFKNAAVIKNMLGKMETEIHELDDDEIIDTIDDNNDIKKYDQFNDDELLQDDLNESVEVSIPTVTRYIRNYLEEENMTIDQLNDTDDETYNDYFFDIIHKLSIKYPKVEYEFNDDVETSLQHLER